MIRVDDVSDVREGYRPVALPLGFSFDSEHTGWDPRQAWRLERFIDATAASRRVGLPEVVWLALHNGEEVM